MSPRTSRKMNDAPEFANHDNKQIRRMLHSLSEAGLIWRVRGSNTGAIYETTADGKILLKEMQKYEIVDN
jgi:predicted transcriptional regulator